MYFDAKTTELAPQLQFYEAATIFHPLLVQNAGTLTETKVRALLNHVPKLNTQVWVDNLVRELPSYLAECMASHPGPDSNGWGSGTAPHCSLCLHNPRLRPLKACFPRSRQWLTTSRVKACKITNQHL